MKKLFSVIAILLLTSSVYGANLQVNCTDAKVKNGPVILSYSIANTASARLASDVTIQGQIYSTFQVAQYMTTKTNLFLMIDDSTATTPIYVFRAGDGRTSVSTACDAQLAIFTNGSQTSAKSLKCKITQ